MTENQKQKLQTISLTIANWVCFQFILLVVLSSNVAFSGEIVEYLPGFDGALPFTLETGYITVEESELFYYFVESEGDPTLDPLLIWISGGPGCSAFNGLIYEIGPLEFNLTYKGGVPSLSYYEYSWTKFASILFIDAPVGTGFSYATSESAYPVSDTISAAQSYVFIKKWLIAHPQFVLNALFVGADSYAGLHAPMMVQQLLNSNKDGEVPRVNVKGYILGCPKTDSNINENSKVIFAHRLALISDELYAAAKNTCNGYYYDIPDSEVECLENLRLVKKCVKDINKANILEAKCTWASPDQNQLVRRAMEEESSNDVMLTGPYYPCHTFRYSLSYLWANDDDVRGALHVRNGTVYDWKRCNKSLSYTYDVTSVLDYHHNLSSLGLQVLIYNGDHDFVIPNVGTEAWIQVLNLTVVNEWRPWFVDGQTAGYTVKHSQNGYRLTYATILGAGHSPQEYRRRECYEMFNRFIHYRPI